MDLDPLKDSMSKDSATAAYLKDAVVCGRLGGMTNRNYLVQVYERKMVLRLPGDGTSAIIDRHAESIHDRMTHGIGINTRTIYFSVRSGIKLSEYVDAAPQLGRRALCTPENVRRISQCLRRLHTSEIRLSRQFDYAVEFERFSAALGRTVFARRMVKHASVYGFFRAARDELVRLPGRLCACHNDPVAENFLLTKDRTYLIDWEYSGMNDPMWDLAAHFIECGFTPADESRFLACYFEGCVDEWVRRKILLFKIIQDVLWAVWSWVKEQAGADFGGYGDSRLVRAGTLAQAYRQLYPTIGR
ncbi:choline/ethanolamine kinase family protein [Burkholderia ubonensis]|uniref:choline/ethanolamine kinase family protein n=1 Tax=Burkholderia ubonensis TaxID=101571 RepID=UPI0007529213|nr:choline/ethanolamine kinase family protein [Burkholderia ubonensis]KWB79396.1 hypothetical protein WL42_12605 [Burkholderia ubonensis]